MSDFTGMSARETTCELVLAGTQIEDDVVDEPALLISDGCFTVFVVGETPRLASLLRQALAQIAPDDDQVWCLRRQDRHDDELTLHSTRPGALAALAVHVRSSWDNVIGCPGIPPAPPADDELAVDLYYGPDKTRGDEQYSLYSQTVADDPRLIEHEPIAKLCDPPLRQVTPTYSEVIRTVACSCGRWTSPVGNVQATQRAFTDHVRAVKQR